MITVEEAKKRKINLVGQGEKSEFIISAMFDRKARKNSYHLIFIKTLINSNLCIKDYTSDNIKHLVITFIIYENFETGVIRQEQKYYDKKEKDLLIDLRNPHYEAFCKATKQEALRIMASEILRGSEKFLKNEPDFDFPKFFDDVKAVFVEKGLILNEG